MKGKVGHCDEYFHMNFEVCSCNTGYVVKHEGNMNMGEYYN